MIPRSRATKSGGLSPARDLSQAVGLSLFPSLEPKPGVAIPREAGVAIPRKADGSLKVAIPRDGVISDAWDSPRKSASHSRHGTKAGKLKLVESRAGARKSWTIATGRGFGEALRVRRSDTGFAVSLRFRDQSDALREPYLCYLTADEWGAAKQGSLEQLLVRISEKMRRRKDATGLAELISRLEATAMNGPERRNTR